QLACPATVERRVHRRKFTTGYGGEVGVVADRLLRGHRFPLCKATPEVRELSFLRRDLRDQVFTICQRGHTRAPSLIAATTSAATSYGLMRPSLAASSRALR